MKHSSIDPEPRQASSFGCSLQSLRLMRNSGLNTHPGSEVTVTPASSTNEALEIKYSRIYTLLRSAVNATPERVTQAASHHSLSTRRRERNPKGICFKGRKLRFT
ncbi:hypothetical protein Baya_13629 [Bagarius yarrelli]|uniref:Uncharacterized protein n=1 Tax=Bagarius yarrelli TaxID=175774 RepID=A0A556V6U7_BAGYA|nr:hypothetical protein Baya_13629 [Bagarius yarrelli]